MEGIVTSVMEEDFRQAMHTVLQMEQSRESIGRLAEKKLHLTLKYFFQPDASLHEQPVGRFVADAITGDGIVEIQTGSFGKLRNKLHAFSALVPVTVVCPIAHRKTISWMEEGTGAFSAPHKSPKRGNYYDAFYELVHIRDCLCMENVTFRLMLLDMQEYRIRNGYGRNKKRWAQRLEKMPVALCGFYDIRTKADLAAFLPPLSSPFTVAECAAAAGIDTVKAAKLLYVLCEKGITVREGKRCNAYLYHICSETM